MCIRFRQGISTGLSREEQQQLIKKVGGRVVIFGNARVEADRKYQTKEVIEEYEKKKEALWRVYQKAEELNVWNEWEEMYNKYE